MNVLALLVCAVALADERPAGAPGEPAIMWDRLRASYASYLAGPGDDPVGGAAAEFLRRSTVSLEAGELQSRLGEDVFAVYDAPARAIRLDRKGLQDVRLSLLSAELQPERAAPFIERTAGALVHELRHAMDHEALGEAPLFLESEIAAYADQAMFLWRRLERDPGYRALRSVDESLSARLERPAPGPAGPNARWWAAPLSKRAVRRLKGAIEEARPSLKGITSQELNDWFLVRAAAGGFDRFQTSLREAGYLPTVSLLRPPGDMAAASRRELEHVWRRLAVLRASRLPPQERERRARALEAELEGAERVAAFWGDAARRRRAGEYVTRALEARRRDWEATNGRHASR
ncbi:MAG: hypothetical protein HY553_10400 [Elusimicrobia bacterium]|nr:hypothetical protein [Elusimicrobiota bacterium]